MGISPPISKEEIQENQRWEDRSGDPLAFDVRVTSEMIKICDEYFSVAELEKEAMVCTSPFKPHHFDLQKELEAIREFLAKHPQRRIGK